MKLIFTLLLAAISLAAAPASAAETIYIIRHLEKAEGSDPPLTEVGAANAQRLAAMLADKGITAIFATPTRRAMETAQPLAQRLGIAIMPYNPRDPDALVAAVGAAAGPVLIVGHSNTVPELVAAFGGAKPGSMTEEDYGTVFLVEGGLVEAMTIH